MGDNRRVWAFLRGEIVIGPSDWRALEEACRFQLDAEDRERLHDALQEAAHIYAMGAAFGLRGANLAAMRRMCRAADALLDAMRALPGDTRRLLHRSMVTILHDDPPPRPEQVAAYRASGCPDPEPLLELLRARCTHFLEGAELRLARPRPDGTSKQKSGRPASRWLEPLAAAALAVWRKHGGVGRGVHWDESEGARRGAALVLVSGMAGIAGLSASPSAVEAYLTRAGA